MVRDVEKVEGQDYETSSDGEGPETRTPPSPPPPPPPPPPPEKAEEGREEGREE